MDAVEPCQDLSISPINFIQTQGNGMVEGVCANLTKGIDCLRPEFQLLKRCSHAGFVAALLVQEMCTDEGILIKSEILFYKSNQNQIKQN